MRAMRRLLPFLLATAAYAISAGPKQPAGRCAANAYYLQWDGEAASGRLWGCREARWQRGPQVWLWRDQAGKVWALVTFDVMMRGSL